MDGWWGWYEIGGFEGLGGGLGCTKGCGFRDGCSGLLVDGLGIGGHSRGLNRVSIREGLWGHDLMTWDEGVPNYAVRPLRNHPPVLALHLLPKR